MHTCPICYEEKCDMIITECNHEFCSECIEDWKKLNPTCPMCRRKIFPETYRMFFKRIFLSTCVVWILYHILLLQFTVELLNLIAAVIILFSLILDAFRQKMVDVPISDIVQ